MKTDRLDVAYLEEGEGPLALLIHGFPDNAHTWTHQMTALAEAGYHAVAPFLRGYAPTENPSDGYYDLATLVEDAASIVRALNGDAPAFVVGHDFGAVTVYGLCGAHPDLVKRAVAMAVTHPAIAPRFIGSFDQAKRSFYMFFFQIPYLPEAAVAMNDFAFIEGLWRDWSPGLDATEHLASVKRTLAEPGVIEAAINYYRTFFDPSRCDPALEATRSAMALPIATPTMTMFGLDDGCLDPSFSEWADEMFTGEYERVMIEKAGHFLHLEQPDEVNAAILRWLAAP